MAFTIIAAILLNKTLLGRYALAIGSNEEATRLSGANVKMRKILIYMTAGIFMAAGAIIFSARTGVAQPAEGLGMELDVIAAVVIGGTSLAGGRANVFGTFVGALLMKTLLTGLQMMQVNQSWQFVVMGVIVLAAVFVDSFRSAGDVPVTMCRINLVDGLGPVIQIAEGWTVELPDEVATAIENRTDRTWPTTWFVPNLTGEGPFTSVYDVMNAWGANHGAISYGHIGARLITLASMLRIPVNMHNVPVAQVFRPKNWLGFGTADLEGADYRACAQFGPLYG